MINYDAVQYNWREMVSECNVAQNACLAMVAQSGINGIILAGDVVVFALQQCSGAVEKVVLIANSSILAVNTLFLGFIIYLKATYHHGEKEPFYKDANKIRQMKCCFDSTIFISICYITMNAAALVAWNYFCK